MANELHDLSADLEILLAAAASAPAVPGVVPDALAQLAGGGLGGPCSDGRDWPMEAADLWVVAAGAPVAVSTLGDPDLAGRLAAAAPAGLSLAGPTATENIGVEKLIRNFLANPALRVLVLAGPETGGTAPMGHFAGDALVNLVARGVDPDTRRIDGAQGRRPFLRNLSPEEVEAFRRRVCLVDRRGTTDVQALASLVSAVGETAAFGPDGPVTGEGQVGPSVREVAQGGVARAYRPAALPEGGPAYVPDPVGYLLIFADHSRGRLLLEHYAPEGTRTAVLAGREAAGLARAAVTQGLVGTLDHAAYLGHELQRAADALARGLPYVQDG